MDDQYFMRQALIEARQAFDDGEIPVGAIIVSQGIIIARTHNLTELLDDVTAHAEMQAITAASQYLGSKYLTDCTLYVTLEPCPMCAAALGWSQISRVVYAASDPRRGYTQFAPALLHPKTQVASGVLSEEALSLLKSFFANRR